MNISVLGCGRWGSFLAWYAHRQGHKVISYGIEDEIFLALQKTRKNEFVTFPKDIEITSDLKYAVSSGDIIIVSISSQQLRGFLTKVAPLFTSNKKLILCMKGIEEGSGKRLSTIAMECGFKKEQVAVWVGPGHIQDFTKNIPNCMVIDTHNAELTKEIVGLFSSDLIRFYYGADLVGTEIGAATKNIFGIAAGVCDGLGCVSLKGPLMARGAREVARLIKAMGGNELSAYGLCHLGDYETTLFSPYSHNRKWGESYTKGEKFTKLAEGVATAKAVTELAKNHGVDMPITFAVNTMIQDKQPPKELLKTFFTRDIKGEFV